MRTVRVYLNTVLTFILILTLFLLSCNKQEETTITEEETQPDSTITNVQQLMLNSQSEFEENINSLMKLIKEKEDELKKAQLELKRKSVELEEKEKLLQLLDAEMKEFRKVSYFIFVIGLILIIVGLVLIFLTRSSTKKSASNITSKQRAKKDRKKSEPGIASESE